MILTPQLLSIHGATGPIILTNETLSNDLICRSADLVAKGPPISGYSSRSLADWQGTFFCTSSILLNLPRVHKQRCQAFSFVNLVHDLDMDVIAFRRFAACNINGSAMLLVNPCTDTFASAPACSNQAASKQSYPM